MYPSLNSEMSKIYSIDQSGLKLNLKTSRDCYQYVVYLK